MEKSCVVPLDGGPIGRQEALELAGAEGPDAFDLFALANRARERSRGKRADLCSIVSAKTGACPEDCSYCAQSARSAAGVEASPLVSVKSVLGRAEAAKVQGARRFCVVASGRRPGKDELSRIAEMVSGIRDAGLSPCATLGLLGEEELSMLKAAGLHRYHHNLETSRRHFPRICRTHTYDDKIKTIRAASRAGLSVCSGGIFGLGETWEDRVDMAGELSALRVDSVPINFIVPIKGTPLGESPMLDPIEALKVVSIYRLMLPEKEIRVCGGRMQTLGELNAFVFMAGADGLLTGDCLTTAGRTPAQDRALVEALGMHA